MLETEHPANGVSQNGQVHLEQLFQTASTPFVPKGYKLVSEQEWDEVKNSVAGLKEWTGYSEDPKLREASRSKITAAVRSTSWLTSAVGFGQTLQLGLRALGAPAGIDYLAGWSGFALGVGDFGATYGQRLGIQLSLRWDRLKDWFKHSEKKLLEVEKEVINPRFLQRTHCLTSLHSLSRLQPAASHIYEGASNYPTVFAPSFYFPAEFALNSKVQE